MLVDQIACDAFAYQSFVRRQEDCDTGVNLADGE